MLAAAALTMAGAVGAVAMLQPEARDPGTLCRLDVQPATHRLIVVDKTDPWSSAQSAFLRAALRELAEAAAAETRISLYGFRGRASALPEPLFDRCKPRSGEKANPLIETPGRIEAAYRESFAQPLAIAARAATRPFEARETRLFAYVAMLAAQARLAGADNIEIVLFSDMAENDTSFTVYRAGRIAFSEAAFAQRFADVVGDRLAGVTLRVRQIGPPRRSAAELARLREAWIAALTRGGAQIDWRRF